MPDKSISLSDLNDDPSLIGQLDPKETDELLADYDKEGGLAGNLASQLSARKEQHVLDATKVDDEDEDDEDDEDDEPAKPAVPAKPAPAPVKKDN